MPQTTEIVQTPFNLTGARAIPVGQELIFVLDNKGAVQNETRVKYCADIYVHIAAPTMTTPGGGSAFIGTFKTTPNGAGVGMFDIRNVVENYVSADSIASTAAQYKGGYNTHLTDSIHLIDKFSQNADTFKYMAVQFYMEYLDTNALSTTYNQVISVAGTEVNSALFAIFNGYVTYEDDIFRNSSITPIIQSYADTQRFVLGALGADNQFLTNAPVEQYANIDDYGTFAMMTGNEDLTRIKLSYYEADGTGASNNYVNRTEANGAWTTWTQNSRKQVIFLGCFPGNLQNWSTQFNPSIMEGGRIEVVALDGVNPISQTYTIHINCDNTKGYESIRMTWLNQWGAWDYYTFTKKSTRTISAKGSTYTQLGGTWQSNNYRINSYQGGKKSFRVNATEKIKMNTGFVSESDNVMFEELMNSPEVYLLKGYQSGTETLSAKNTYVQPVRVTSSSFTTKTIANDRLLQYTFEIEKSKTQRTQSI